MFHDLNCMPRSGARLTTWRNTHENANTRQKTILPKTSQRIQKKEKAKKRSNLAGCALCLRPNKLEVEPH
jgi:hypothetical protein